MLENFNTLVLVADTVKNHIDTSISSNDFEKAEEEYISQLLISLKNLSKNVVHIQEPSELFSYIGSSIIVLSIWSGNKSKFRKVLTSSVCEVLKLKYIGSDPYTSLICQDKELSKRYALKFGIKSARGFLVGLNSLSAAYPKLSKPIVVKPNFEGGSIGIDNSCLVNKMSLAIEKAKQMSLQYSQDILVEEFLYGREISFIISGNKNGITFFEVVELYFEEYPYFLYENIYSLNIKKLDNKKLTVKHKLITHEIKDSLKSQVKTLFMSLQKCEILRIDGKLNKNNFKLIELTPDIHLGIGASFNSAFELKGYSYKEMLKLILDN